MTRIRRGFGDHRRRRIQRRRRLRMPRHVEGPEWPARGRFEAANGTRAGDHVEARVAKGGSRDHRAAQRLLPAEPAVVPTDAVTRTVARAEIDMLRTDRRLGEDPVGNVVAPALLSGPR